MADKPNFDKAYDVFKNDPQRLAIVKQWEEEYRRAALDKNLYDHGAVQKLIEQLTKFVDENNEKLRTMKRSDYERDDLFFEARLRLEEANNCWTWLMFIFTKAESKMSTVGSMVGKIK